jgi:hypothetical protein
MQLMMFIGNDLIESIQLVDANIPKPGYIGQFKRAMKQKHQAIIREYDSPPEFLITSIAPPEGRAADLNFRKPA